MEEFFNILSHLEVRFFQSLSPKSNDRTPTAVFQFVARDTNEFRIQINANYRFRFEAFYEHQGKFYPHPYILRSRINLSSDNTSVFEEYQEMIYHISLFLELKCLKDFEIDDLKRYYEVIDKNLDIKVDFHDFHDVYLVLFYEINGHSTQYKCNNGQPIHLPRLISNPWTYKNTVIRFRYDAENRDGTFPCEMTLCLGNIANLQSYKIVLCLTTNTIPARMDYHVIRWLYKLKPKVSKQNGLITKFIEKEKSYCLNHLSGIVVAQVYGPDLKFTPQLPHSANNLNYVRSYYEPEGFRTELQNSDNKDTSALAIGVVKGTDYPNLMKNRRKDKNILRYLPFYELEDVDNHVEISNEKIIKRLKTHKEQCGKQLILYDENEKGTYSQAHVRLYVAAYDENDVLLTEALHPPLRNNKAFEQLCIIRLVQPRCELRANESAQVYCNYDYSKSKSGHDTCPYEFELVFLPSLNTPNENQLLKLFNKPQIIATASYVPNCPCLLQFQVPNDSRYHEHRIFIRLRHIKSKDYNPSSIALNDNVCWIYYADPTSVADSHAVNLLNDASRTNPTNTNDNVELIIQAADQHLLPEYSTYDSENSNEDNNNSIRTLHTPNFESTTSQRFIFP